MSDPLIVVLVGLVIVALPLVVVFVIAAIINYFWEKKT